jgi:4-hydroxy-tetrahydrodipicolinate synthase
MTHPFAGAGVALVTPFKEDKSVDFDALGRLVENQIGGGTDYLVVLGTTAETPALTDAEKKEIVRFVIEKNAGRLKVVVGMGGNNTTGLAQSIKRGDFKGVDGILSVVPYYNKPTQEGIFQHFQMIVEASPVPVILYNVPGRTGVNMDADTAIRIANISNKVVGVKEASGDLGQIAKIIKNAPEYFKVISGDDAMTLPVISMGGIGVISVIANALPEKLSHLTHAALDANLTVASQLHLQLSEMLKLIFKDGNPAGVKCLMELMGTAQNQLRLPLVQATAATRAAIEAEWKKLP